MLGEGSRENVRTQKKICMSNLRIYNYIIAIAVIQLHILLLVIEMFVVLADDEYNSSDHCLLFIRYRRIMLHDEDKSPKDE